MSLKTFMSYFNIVVCIAVAIANIVYMFIFYNIRSGANLIATEIALVASSFIAFKVAFTIYKWRIKEKI